MNHNDPLLDVAVAIADGTNVDWSSVTDSAGSEEQRRVLEELQFIARVVQPANEWGRCA